ncbi:Double zinc ribbon [Thermincola ferriacetica]|uniref:Double zinc ribbon n=1 Tax=Thermincola ferriacetica TaxID=281456 RepID=A0A0L6W4U9_9FIRM|nr:zinc ribbon domain-containing protein [Thermincola ferriacetica]KNZ70555.1 Double zinc ribbon [Thermincola ferriacetica]
MSQNNSQETLKNIGVLSLVLLGVLLIFNLLTGSGSGMGYGMYGRGTGLELNGLLASLFTLAVKLLWLVFVISLIAGIVMFAKKYFVEEKNINLQFLGNLVPSAAGTAACPECGSKVAPEYKFCPNCRAVLSSTCNQCGNSLQPGWKCCPACGTEINNKRKGEKNESVV